ncbi:MAG TPA: histidinol dehydrogenase [Thermodesulfobacteriota bacterium]|nr:histidinol dehydrogenase [Thermodesulfobacteriota bacterium]
MRIIRLKKNNLAQKLKGLRGESKLFDPGVESAVKKIVEAVRKDGDRALFKFTKKFDKVELSTKTVKVSTREVEEAKAKVSPEIKSSLTVAASRIHFYQQMKLPQEKTFTDSLGNELGWLLRPLERVGVYIPGGKAAYPSTVLMTAIPAKVAGVEEVVLVSPCPRGEVNPVVLVAASMAGVDVIYKVGGAQAISALAYGTESIPKVDKIVGPGNIYVTIAKKLVFGEVDIDMIAGPSEVLIVSDGSTPPGWIAADLLAQAEHDEMAVPILVTDSSEFADEVKKEISKRLKTLERREIAKEAVRNQGKIFVVDSMEDAVSAVNAIAPEHLELCVENPKSILPGIKHAGAIFLGGMSTEAFGDYVAGPSHVLPTGGAARFSSPLSVYDFLRMPSVISVSESGFKELEQSVTRLAYSEGLEAHALSVKARFENRS